MMREREAEVLEDIKRTRPGVIGFAPPEPAVSEAASEVTVSPKMRAALRKAGEAAAQDLHRAWTGAGGDVLQKRAATGWLRHEEERAAAYAKGQRAGAALVAALRKRAQAPAVPRGAIADAREEADRLEIAKAAGAKAVYATDILPHRLELAEKMGATIAINSSETDPVEVIKRETGGIGGP